MAAVNETSEIPIGKWWIFSVKYLTPVILTIILLAKIGTTIMHGYGGYPGWALLMGGFAPIMLILFLSFYLSGRLKPRG